jgi:hypothetical protein
MPSFLRRLARLRSAQLGLVAAAVAISLSACLPPAPNPDPGPTDTLAAPSWWSGSCDSGNYAGAHPLGASYRGVEVCGPRPGADGGANRMVRFFSGAWGELEWQCVELSMRYMYLAYGVHPYGANGLDVVANYTAADGGGLVKIANGTVGTPPQPGDVLSFGPTATSPLGHTGVVVTTLAGANGNGTIHMLSQNDSADGWRNVSMTNWTVDGASAGLGAVTAWLHKPGG